LRLSAVIKSPTTSPKVEVEGAAILDLDFSTFYLQLGLRYTF
jgi:hypothetical protein